MKTKLLLAVSLFTTTYLKAQTITELGFFAPLINSEDMKYTNNHVVIAQQGLKIFNITNPANPVLSGSAAYPGSGNAPHQLDVEGTYAYLGEGGGGVFAVYNIANLSSPSLTGSVSIPSSAFITGGDLIVKGSTAYMTGADSLYVIDASTAAAPVLAAALQVVNLPPFGNASSMAIDGNTLFVLHTLGIAVYDITSPFAPSLLSTLPLTHGYHNGLTTDTVNHRLFSPWVSVLQSHLGYNAYDISTPANPVYLFSDSITPGAGDFGNCDYYNNALVISRGGSVHLFNVSPINHAFITSFSGQNVANSGTAIEFRDSVFINGRRGGFEVLEYNGGFTTIIIENNSSDNDIHIFPNPLASATAEITVKGNFSADAIITLMNPQGEILSSANASGNSKIKLATGGNKFAPGVYFLTIINHNQTTTKKFIVTQ